MLVLVSKEGQSDNMGSTWTLNVELHGVQSPELPLPSSVTLGKLLNLSGLVS